MSASEATAPVEGSAQPTRWSPRDVSKNQLNKSPQCADDPRGGFVQFREKFGRVHEGNTGASPKSFRKGGTRCPQRVGNSIGLRDSRSSSEKPIHLAWGRLPALEDRCET